MSKKREFLGIGGNKYLGLDVGNGTKKLKYMGYKRMKKKKYRVSKEERLQMHISYKFRKVPFYAHPDLWELGDWLRWSDISKKRK